MPKLASSTDSTDACGFGSASYWLASQSESALKTRSVLLADHHRRLEIAHQAFSFSHLRAISNGHCVGAVVGTSSAA